MLVGRFFSPTIILFPNRPGLYRSCGGGGPAAKRHDTGRAPLTGLWCCCCRRRRGRRRVRASSAGCARPSQIRRGVDNGRRRR